MPCNIKFLCLINHPHSLCVILFIRCLFAYLGGELVLMSWPQGSEVKLSSSWVVCTAGPLCFGRQLEIDLSVCVFVCLSQNERLWFYVCGYWCVSVLKYGSAGLNVLLIQIPETSAAAAAAAAASTQSSVCQISPTPTSFTQAKKWIEECYTSITSSFVWKRSHPCIHYSWTPTFLCASLTRMFLQFLKVLILISYFVVYYRVNWQSVCLLSINHQHCKNQKMKKTQL